MKVVCSSVSNELAELPAEVGKVLLFGRSDTAGTGSVGVSIRRYLEKRKHQSADRALDLVGLALSVLAADQFVRRETSGDGWTREIELHVSVLDHAFWSEQVHVVNQMLQFLTTDRWCVVFTPTNERPKFDGDPQYLPQKSISLLSGGLDSLIAAVNFSVDKEPVLLVSQVAKGDREKQQTFSQLLGLSHLQLKHGAQLPGKNEDSTRSRSLVFISYGVLAATLLECYQRETVAITIPENGFMSINPPLTDARLGALSTRTTHPVFIHHLQTILDSAGINASLQNPYQHLTKGEMLKTCKDQGFLAKYAHTSTSCGRFVRTGYVHCGRCVPCLVRRAAFHNSGLDDRTKYKYSQLRKNNADHAKFDDVRSAAMAAEVVRTQGVRSWIGASLASVHIPDPASYRLTVERGILELGAFLKAAGVK